MVELNVQEGVQLYRVLNTLLAELLWDYSCSLDMAVVNINNQPLVFDKAQIRTLSNIKNLIEEELE